ncbi:hypothetical protein AB0H00_24990 [Nocardia sp. NPDC023852]|uniref:hypothetical protein n=1 Tax=Nocardia sp. NPDC023852 TaxID=3154697 RepID=UPI0034072301
MDRQVEADGMDVDAKRIRVEAELSRLSVDLKDIASNIHDVFDTLNVKTEPLMAQPLCDTNASGDHFKKDWSKQNEAICKGGESFEKLLNEDFAGGIDKSVKLLHNIDVERRRAIGNVTPIGWSESAVEGVGGGGKA